MIEGISAVTLGTHEMPRAVRFYGALGFEVLRGGEGSSFISFRAGASFLNLIASRAVLVLVGAGNLLRCRC
jgi:catechol 2,3-dioxygenase-like lactoylglutathione lyase family enzyme